MSWAVTSALFSTTNHTAIVFRRHPYPCNANISTRLKPSEKKPRQTSTHPLSSLLLLRPDSSLTACTLTGRSFSWHFRHGKVEPEEFMACLIDLLVFCFFGPLVILQVGSRQQFWLPPSGFFCILTRQPQMILSSGGVRTMQRVIPSNTGYG